MLKSLSCVILAICFLTCVLLTREAQAQQGPGATSTSLSEQDLAKSVHNPFEDFIKIPVQVELGLRIGPKHNAGVSTNVQPLVPFRLTNDWDLIVRPSESMTYLPSPHEQFGPNDLQASFFLTPHGANKWIWGLGPIFECPTATGKQLGTGRWSAGPTGALIYSNGPWFNGILTYQLMSFAGDRRRGSVNQTYIEPLISYNLDNGWYGQVDPPITYDWTTETQDAWVLPIGADIGKAFNIGRQSMSLQIGSYDLLKHPDGGPQWMIRAQFTLLFPSEWLSLR